MLAYIALGIWGLACLGFVCFEVRWGAFWVSVVLAVVAMFFLGFNVFTFAWANPVLVGQYAALYAAIGLVWASFKFVIKLRKARNLYVTDKAEWLGNGTGRNEAQWIEKVKGSYGDKAKYAPTVAENKYDIMFWCWHWPFSVIAFLFEDLIKELWNLTWRMIKGFMEGLRKAALGEAAKDLD